MICESALITPRGLGIRVSFLEETLGHDAVSFAIDVGGK